MDKDKIKAVIENDCQAQFEYYTSDGATCAIGALLEAANFNMERFHEDWEEEDSKAIENSDQVYSIWDIVGDTLEKEYNLTGDDAHSIQRLNDFNDTPESRRTAILAWLEEQD